MNLYAPKREMAAEPMGFEATDLDEEGFSSRAFSHT